MQAISNPPYCFYIFIRCNGLYFLSNIAYMHIQCLCFTHIWLIPRIFKYILLAKHLLRVLSSNSSIANSCFVILGSTLPPILTSKVERVSTISPELKPSAALSFPVYHPLLSLPFLLLFLLLLHFFVSASYDEAAPEYVPIPL